MDKTNTLKIVTITDGDDEWGDGGTLSQEFYLNDEFLGSGHYRPEPEDATYERDLGWADGVIEDLAKRLGCEVEYEFKTDD